MNEVKKRLLGIIELVDLYKRGFTDIDY